MWGTTDAVNAKSWRGWMTPEWELAGEQCRAANNLRPTLDIDFDAYDLEAVLICPSRGAHDVVGARCAVLKVAGPYELGDFERELRCESLAEPPNSIGIETDRGTSALVMRQAMRG